MRAPFGFCPAPQQRGSTGPTRTPSASEASLLLRSMEPLPGKGEEAEACCVRPELLLAGAVGRRRRSSSSRPWPSSSLPPRFGMTGRQLGSGYCQVAARLSVSAAVVVRIRSGVSVQAEKSGELG